MQNQTIPLILGQALCAVFSEAQLVHYAQYEGAFYYEVALHQPLTSELLSILQEEMYRILEEQPVFQIHEMIPSNAAELFAYQKQTIRSLQMKTSKQPLVQLVQMGNFYDLDLESIQEPFDGRFQLTSFEKAEYELEGTSIPTYRIHGLYAQDKQKLKKKVQQSKEIQKACHKKWGANLNLFEIQGKSTLFFSRGLELEERLEQKTKALFRQFDFEALLLNPFSEKHFIELIQEESLSNKIYTKSLKKTNSLPLFFTGLYQVQDLEVFQFKIYCNSRKELKQECIYCLKFYLEIIKILGFSCGLEYNPQSWGHSLETLLDDYEVSSTSSSEIKGFKLHLKDHWERNLFSFSLEIKELEGQPLIEGELPPLKKMLAWMLEDRQGSLPKDLLAPSLHILPAKGGEKYAKEVSQYLKKSEIHVSIDQTQTKFEKKLYHALKRQLPYIAIIGTKEETEQKVTLRKASDTAQISLTKEALLEELRT